MTRRRAFVAFRLADQFHIGSVVVERQIVGQALIARARAIVRRPLTGGRTIAVAITATSPAAATSAARPAAIIVARPAGRLTARPACRFTSLWATRRKTIICFAAARCRRQLRSQIQIAGLIQIQFRAFIQFEFGLGRRTKILQVVVLILESRWLCGSGGRRTLVATASPPTSAAAAPPAATFARVFFRLAQPAGRITAQPAGRITAPLTHRRPAPVRILVARFAHRRSRRFAQVQIAVALHFVVQHEAFVVLRAERGRCNFAALRCGLAAGRFAAT
jgi:hypothetical protein